MSKNWLVHDANMDEYNVFDTQEEAIECAKDYIESYRTDDHWPEDLEGAITVSKITHVSVQFDYRKKPTDPKELEEWPDPEWDYICDYKMEEVKEGK
jgi:hypothetical protein